MAQGCTQPGTWPRRIAPGISRRPRNATLDVLIASGGRAPRSRTTRVAARRSSAGSTASRYGSPPRSRVAVEARKTVIAVKSGWEAIVGCIGTKTAHNAHSVVGSRESGNAVLALIGNAHDAGPFFGFTLRSHWTRSSSVKASPSVSRRLTRKARLYAAYPHKSQVVVPSIAEQTHTLAPFGS